MITSTEAIALRISPFSETSHIVVWLTPAYGKLVTIVKGACRPKSYFLGQYDLFYTCELLFYMREREGIYIAKECAPLKIRPRFRTDWRAFLAASYVGALITAVTLPGEHQAEVYRHTALTLDSLSDFGADAELVFWFELRLASLLGFAPQLWKCSACNVEISGASTTTFGWARGGLLCPRCSRKEPASTMRLTPSVLAILRCWQRAGSPRTAKSIRCTEHQLATIGTSLEVFLRYHLEPVPSMRTEVLNILAEHRK